MNISLGCVNKYSASKISLVCLYCETRLQNDIKRFLRLTSEKLKDKLWPECTQSRQTLARAYSINLSSYSLLVYIEIVVLALSDTVPYYRHKQIHFKHQEPKETSFRPSSFLSENSSINSWGQYHSEIAFKKRCSIELTLRLYPCNIYTSTSCHM